MIQQFRPERSETQTTSTLLEASQAHAATLMQNQDSRPNSPELLDSIQGPPLGDFGFGLDMNEILMSGVITQETDGNFEGGFDESLYLHRTNRTLSLVRKFGRSDGPYQHRVVQRQTNECFNITAITRDEPEKQVVTSQRSRHGTVPDASRTRAQLQDAIVAAEDAFETWGEFFNCYRHMTTADPDIYLVIAANIRSVANIINEQHDIVSRNTSSASVGNESIRSLPSDRLPSPQYQWALAIQPRPGSIEQHFVSSSLLFDVMSSTATASHRLQTLATQHKTKLQSTPQSTSHTDVQRGNAAHGNVMATIQSLDYVLEVLDGTTMEMKDRMAQLSARFTDSPRDESPVRGMERV
ncbi:uncharacterized protein N0V89_008918 [Didymosphaeria variabile]|uniref:Uncharacterized protein n=1 Tax=Didymosphaeria variabile TaxID=1932322 RepID=A0A9W8XIH6_9PLEO|nr:uncharacterized protein N0V89_008918 [Didymosphaeria variabile]KAJ4350297.1 hypothetical protein N0V89_008918 [Didymosphaeria variabile]